MRWRFMQDGAGAPVKCMTAIQFAKLQRHAFDQRIGKQRCAQRFIAQFSQMMPGAIHPFFGDDAMSEYDRRVPAIQMNFP